MNEANEVVRVLDAIKRLSPEHRQRAESIAVVVEQALASAQNTIAALQKQVAEMERTLSDERQRREDAESIIRLYLTDQRGIPAHLNPGNVYFARYPDTGKP